MRFPPFVPGIALLAALLPVACNGGGAPTAPPGIYRLEARFTHTAPGGYIAGEVVQFDASSSSAPFYKIVEFAWDWGDGSEKRTFPTAAASHIFDRPGTYEVRLTIRDQAGKEASTKQEIRIDPVGSPPTACFTYEAPDGWQPGSELVFDASCSTDPDGDELAYEWDWGDGQASGPSHDPVASHVFASEGQFDVVLTVEDSAGWRVSSDPARLSLGYPRSAPVVASLPEAGDATDIAISGSYVYVADYLSGLRVIDIGNPVDPLLVGSLATGGATRLVDTSGDTAILGDGFQMLRIIDVSDPASPALLGSKKIPRNIEDIALGDGVVYVSDSDGLTVLDISNPADPRICRTIEHKPGPRTVRTEGDLLYHVAGDEVAIFDVSNPTDPVLTGTYSCSPTRIWSMEVSGSILYLILGTNRLVTVDAGDPADPKELGSCAAYGDGDMSVSGGVLVLINGTVGLEFVDVSDPAFPEPIGSAFTLGSPYAVKASGNYAFVADNMNGLTVVDISDPSGPHPISAIESTDLGNILGPADIKIAGDWAYLATSPTGLSVINIADPSDPQIVGQIATGMELEGIAVLGDYVYGVDFDRGLVAVDLSDKTDPRTVSEVGIYGARAVAVSGEHAFLTGTSGFGLQVVDISDPANMQIVGGIPHGFRGKSIVIEGQHAYVGCNAVGTMGLWAVLAVDISDPVNPALMGWVEVFEGVDGPITDVAVSGDRLCVMIMPWSGHSILKVLDISDPSSPCVTGEIRTKDSCSDLDLSGRFAYVADRTAGLTMVDLTDPYQPAIVGHSCAPPHAVRVAVQCNLACVLSMTSSEWSAFSTIELW
jgi:hypothetical protein